MYNENYVIFKGTKDGVTVIFDPEVSFETLCTQLEKKVAEAGKFFDNVKTSLAFKGRVFTEEEEETPFNTYKKRRFSTLGSAV